jgi:hypothetical protein
MKKFGLPLLLALILLLTSCISSASTQTTANTQATSAPSDNLDTNATDAVPAELQLLLGTFKLEGSDLAVTTAQAATLLPLWQQLQNLSQSSSPAAGQGITATTVPTTSSTSDTQSQVDGLVQQIQAGMTTDQIQAINAMQFTQDSIMTILQAQGLNMGGPGSQAGNGQQPPQGTPPSGNGQAPQGAPASGNGPVPQGTPQPGGFPSGQMGLVPPQLIDALVQLLQNRANGTDASSASTTNPANPNSSGAASNSSASAVYTLDGKSDTQTGQTYSASTSDETAVYVNNGGSLTLSDSIVISTGNTSSTDNSSFYGLNAAVLAAGGSSINMSNSQVKTSGTGANGIFSTGTNSNVSLSNLKITATGDGGHAVMATQGGSMTITNTDMSTTGGSSSAIATDRGGGTITVNGGTVQTSGMNSAGIYSTGNITATSTSFVSTGAEVAVIEGANSISLTNTDLSSSKAGKWGVMIYQSMSGDAQGTQGTFTMTGGSLSYTASDGPLFYITNSTGVITLKGVNLNAASDILVKAASGNWGNHGSNGGNVVLTADGQVLKGNIVVDSISTANLMLQNNSTLEGAINSDHTAKAANLSLDATSTWTVTADSTLAILKDASGIAGTTITNITGNGHTVYYDASLADNSYLGGKNYSLAGGGQLEPRQ